MRAALYERVSTDEQALHGYSIQTQIDNLSDYCRAHGLVIAGHYTDEGISGSKSPLKRPAMSRLMKDIESGKIDIVLFTKLDRWFRNVKEYFKAQDILDRHHVQWKTIHEDYDTTTANGRMAITIMLSVAQNERERTSERIKVVFDNRLKNGNWVLGGPPPTGYIKADVNGVTRLIKDPSLEPYFTAFFDDLKATHNISHARNVMQTMGYTIRYDTARQIAHRTIYTGRYKGAQITEPYISAEEHALFKSNRVKHTPSGTVYIFSGLLTCPYCGRSLCAHYNIAKGKSYNNYYCSNHTEEHICIGSSISEIKLENMLLDNLDSLIEHHKLTIQEQYKKKANRPPVDIRSLRDRLKRLNNLYLDGFIDDADFHSQADAIKETISSAESLPPPPDTSHLDRIYKSDLKSLYHSFDRYEKRRFWSSIISNIQISNTHEIESIFFR